MFIGNFVFNITGSSLPGTHSKQSAVEAGLGVSVIDKSAVTDRLQVLEGIYPALAKTSICSYTRPDEPDLLVDRFLSCLVEGLTV